MSNPAPAISPIKHVFVLMLENHSFDQFFALSKIPGLKVATSADVNIANGRSYKFGDGPAPTGMPTDPDHEFNDVVQQLTGKTKVGKTPAYPPGGPYPPIDNSGFAANYASSTSNGNTLPTPDQVQDLMNGFVTQEQLPVLYQLATEFAICDQWFSSIPGPTWPNRFFVHGASSNGWDSSPKGSQSTIWETVDGFQYPNGSIFDALKARGIDWGIYNDNENMFSDTPGKGWPIGSIAQVASLKGIHLWNVNSLKHFKEDLNGIDENAYTYQYTFIEPNYGAISDNFIGGSSQHPMDDVHAGELLIKAVYEALVSSPLWESSMLVITYDEHGGFYDSQQPGPAVPPNDGSDNKHNASKFAFDRYGVRVPAVVVSPFIPKGTVDHTIYDHSSIPKTLETLFGMDSLTDRDKHAKDLLSLCSLPKPRDKSDYPLELTMPAAAMKLARAVLPTAAHAQKMKKPLPDKAGNLHGFLHILLKTDLELSDRTPESHAAILATYKAIKTRADADAYIRHVMAKVAAANKTH